MPVLLTILVNGILVVCRCIQKNFLIFIFVSNVFFKSLWKRETHFFWELIAYEQYKFHEQTTNLQVS